MSRMVVLAVVLALLASGCNLFGEECGLPRQDQNPTVFINHTGGGGQDCAEVSEGFELFLDWAYITGDDGGDRRSRSPASTASTCSRAAQSDATSRRSP